MNIAESSVKYPVTQITRVLLVIVFGYVCVTFLTIELKPETEQPVLVVTTPFVGAAPEEVEGEVTNRFEETISGVSNMIYTQSLSRHGESRILVFYKTGTNPDLAAAELQRNIDRVKDLPKGVDKPQISKASDLVSLPIYQFALTGDVDLVTMTTWADKDIAPRIKRISGVGDCQYDGGRNREMRITFDPTRLKARRLSVAQVKQRIDRRNLNQSGGYFVQGDREWTVRTVGELLNAAAFRRVIISEAGEPIVHLSDVATIEDMFERPDSYCRINGVPGIVFSVLNQAGSNLVQTIDLIDRELPLLQKEYGPLGVKFRKLYDQSAYIRDAVRIVIRCLVEAALLVLVVLFVFLKRWRSIVIVAISIPVSIVGTFIGMYVFGYSINVLSLAGLALSVGMIVDDSIVVLENIHRHHYEEGKELLQACIDGTKEVGMAAFMCTLTTAAVFLPVLMLKGEVGTLFGPVAFVISFAIFVSLFDAFTVVPMLASKWMQEEAPVTIHRENPAQAGKPDERLPSESHGTLHSLVSKLSFLDNLGSRVSQIILGSVRFFLNGTGRRWALITVVSALCVSSYVLLPGMGYLPNGGTNLIKVQLETPEGTSLDENSRLMRILEERWNEIPGVRSLVATPNRAPDRNVIFLVCEKEDVSGIPPERIARQVVETSADLPFRIVNPIQFPLFGNINTRSSIVNLWVNGASYQVIDRVIREIMDIGRSTKGVVFWYTDLALHKPQVEVRVDAERAAHFGFTVRAVADAVEAAIGGQRTSTQYDVEGRYFYIRVMGPEKDFRSVADLGKVILTSGQNGGAASPGNEITSRNREGGRLRGEMVSPSTSAARRATSGPAEPSYGRVQIPLTSVARIQPTYGPVQIAHFNSKRSAQAQFTLSGRPLGDVFEDVMSRIDAEVSFPPGYDLVPFGAVNELHTLIEAVRFVFPFSVIVVYLLLVMQFQSFVRPLSILLSVPLSILGANILVKATGVPFDSFTILGYIMMVGLAVKNAILLVTYAVQLMDEQGVEREEALILASERRMRPIFMTAIAMVLGMLPLALKHGAGAEIYNGLAMAVVGGLSIATLLTLVFVPVVYVALDDLKKRFWRVQPIGMEENGA